MTPKAKRAENYLLVYSIHEPNQQELHQQELAKRLERLKKLMSSLPSVKKNNPLVICD